MVTGRSSFTKAFANGSVFILNPAARNFATPPWMGIFMTALPVCIRENRVEKFVVLYTELGELRTAPNFPGVKATAAAETGKIEPTQGS